MCKKLKILYFSQFYTPESIAPSFRATENSKLWVQMGHDVTIFTGYPNYPVGRIFEGYIPKLLQYEEINGVKVWRSKLVAKPNTSILKRLENALSYFFFGLLNILFNNKKIGRNFDVVLGTSGVIFNALLAYIFSVLYKVPFVFEIRDITYVQMQATGKSKNNFSVKCMKMLELFLCSKAQRVVVVTEGFKKNLISESVPTEKITVIMNGVDVESSIGVYNSGKPFVLSYFGTLGLSQNIADTFEYGAVINESVHNFEYLIIGEGAQKKELEKQIQNASYVRMLPGMSVEELESYYNDTQMSVITLRKSDNFKYTIPSKLFQIMGRGIAVLFIGPDGEAAEIIRKYNAGIALTGSKGEDINVLKDFLAKEDWYEQLKEMGENGRRAVEEHYSRTQLAEEYIKVLGDVRRK